MIQEAFAYIGRSEDSSKTLAIGTLLILLGILIVPLVFLLGFYVRLFRHARTDDDMPEFDHWKELGIDGLKAMVITFVYSLVPILLLTFGIAMANPTIDSTTGAITNLEFTTASIVMLGIGLFVLALVAYFQPIALTHFAEARKLGKAFAFGEFKQAATSSTYATAWLLAILVGIVGGAVTGLLTALPLLGFFFAALVSFYLITVTSYLYARGVGVSEGLPEKPEPGDVTGPAV
ncbi:DUF4013 domain-containing protein [Haloarchaeobius sp. DFWS5]|uniref:DUF4013 domain-containing protein n=1 Tax=Haloarchaeobius sp. DFWS5 TaxID=3446114 RepID=UPI003EBC114B